MTAQSGPARGTQARAFGEGPLARFTDAVYRHAVVGLLVVLASTPGILAFAFLDRSAGNVPLAVLCLVPAGPAIAAGQRAFADSAGGELSAGPAFVRAYRDSVGQVLRLWVPALVALAVVSFTLVHLELADVPTAYAGVLVVVALGIATWALHAVTIAARFRFRTRDTARLAAHYLGRLPVVTLGVVALLVVLAGVVLVTTEAVLVLLSGVWVAFLELGQRPLVAHVRARFVA